MVNETTAKKEKKAKDLKVKIENEENDSDEKCETEDLFKNLYEKIVPESVSINDVMGVHVDMKFMQLPSGTNKEDKVDKTTDLSAIIAVLQAIFAILLVSGKTLHEQSLLITSLSKLSQPCLLNHLQTEGLLSPSLPCSCRQSQIRRCCDITITTPMLTKVTKKNAANARFAWIRRTFTALCSVSEVVVAAGALVGRVVYQGLVPGA